MTSTLAPHSPDHHSQTRTTPKGYPFALHAERAPPGSGVPAIHRHARTSVRGWKAAQITLT
jgi:hypothetical protein